jgi:hypothetical protein
MTVHMSIRIAWHDRRKLRGKLKGSDIFGFRKEDIHALSRTGGVWLSG